MFNPAVPPHETITPRRKKMIAEMEDFQQMHYKFLEEMRINVNNEGENKETEEVSKLMDMQVEAYEKMRNFIGSL